MNARFRGLREKTAEPAFWGLRVTRLPPKYRSTAADGVASLTEAGKNRDRTGRDASKKRRYSLLFSVSLFDKIDDEGICGRFGLFRRTGRLHIGSLGDTR